MSIIKTLFYIIFCLRDFSVLPFSADIQANFSRKMLLKIFTREGTSSLHENSKLKLGKNRMCTEIVSDIQNNYCTQHILPMFCKKEALLTKIYLYLSEIYIIHSTYLIYQCSSNFILLLCSARIFDIFVSFAFIEGESSSN